MANIILLPSDQKSRELFLDSKGIPVNYMADFSVMGLLVNQYPESLHVLSSSGYEIQQNSIGANIRIENANQITKIKSILHGNNIICEYADIADTIYQA